MKTGLYVTGLLLERGKLKGPTHQESLQTQTSKSSDMAVERSTVLGVCHPAVPFLVHPREKRAPTDTKESLCNDH